MTAAEVEQVRARKKKIFMSGGVIQGFDAETDFVLTGLVKYDEKLQKAYEQFPRLKIVSAAFLDDWLQSGQQPVVANYLVPSA